MHIMCQQSTFSKALAMVGHALPSRSTLPILACVKLEVTEEGGCWLAATNLEIGIRVRLETTSLAEAGCIAVPARTLIELATNLEAGPIEMQYEEGVLQVRTAKNRAQIKAQSADEFPGMPGPAPDCRSVTLESGVLRTLIERVIFAIADDDSRPALTGIHLSLKPTDITMAAADAFMLALTTHAVPSDRDLPALLIPGSSLKELARLLSRDEQPVHVIMGDPDQVLFHAEHFDLLSRLIVAEFPNYQPLLAKECKTRAVVGTRELVAATKSVEVFARNASNIVRMRIGEDSLTLEATAEDVGGNVCTVAASVDGSGMEIALNVKYLAETLAAIETPQTAIELLSPQRPAEFKPVGDLVHRCIVMPMSTNR